MPSSSTNREQLSSTLNVYHYRRPNFYERCTTTNMYDYMMTRQDLEPLPSREQLLPLPSPREQLLPLPSLCTTTSHDDSRTTTSTTNAFRPECMPRRYNPETTPVNECCVLYKIFGFAPCSNCRCTLPLFCLVTVIDSWDTRYPGVPHHLLHASTYLSFASVSQSSYRNRNVAVAPFSLSLPWHPFSFHHGDKCLIICSC